MATGQAHPSVSWVLPTTLASGPVRLKSQARECFLPSLWIKPGRSQGACCFFAQGRTRLAQEGGCCGDWAGENQAVGEPARQPESK